MTSKIKWKFEAITEKSDQKLLALSAFSLEITSPTRMLDILGKSKFLSYDHIDPLHFPDS